MATPQAKLFSIPGLGSENAYTAQEGVEVVTDDQTTGGGLVRSVETGAQIPPRVTPITQPAPAPQPQPSGFSFSMPIQFPIFGAQPLWLVIAAGAAIYFLVLPMLSEHKGRKR